MAADGRGDVARTLGLAAKFCEFVIALHGGWRHTGPLWDGDCTCGGATTGGCGIDGLRRRCDALVSFPTSGGARRRRSGRRLLRACRNRVRCERKSAKHVRCMLLVGCNPTRPFLIASSQLSKYRLQSTLHAPLSGSIPTGLAAISALQRLDLSGAGLSGPIPTEMGSLAASLTVLVLSSNNLTGTIPTQLGLLTQLTSLALGQNHLTGHIPTELGNIHNLTHISIESNNLTGAVPNEMGRLFYLEYINIEHNVLSGDVPFILTSFKESYYDYNCFTSQVLRSNYCDLPPEAFGGTSPPTGNWTSIAALIGGFVAVAVMCFLVTAYFLYRRVYPKSTFEFPPHVPSERSSRGSSSLRSSRSQTSVYTCTDNDEFLRASAAEAYPPPAFEACARGASAVIKEWTFLPLASRTAGGTEGVPLAAMETPSLTVQDTARCGAVVKAEDAGACAGALIIPGEDVFRWSAEEAAAWAAGLPQFGDALGLAFRECNVTGRQLMHLTRETMRKDFGLNVAKRIQLEREIWNLFQGACSHSGVGVVSIDTGNMGLPSYRRDVETPGHASPTTTPHIALLVEAEEHVV